MDYICYYCQNPFFPKYKPSNPEKPFCSLSCSVKHQHATGKVPHKVRPTYTCTNCNKEFQGNPRNKQKPFCSLSCAATYNNSHKPFKYVCPCGKRASRKFCSHKCFQQSQRDARINYWLTTGVIPTKSGSHLSPCYKEYILKEQGNKCLICGLPPVWNGKPLTMILDHIDGNATNNHRSNLRCICPNCDIQLPTSKGKNRGNGRHYRRLRYAQGKSH